MKKKLWFLIFSFSFLLGCGYKLLGHGSSVPPDVHSISIPTFSNTSQEPAIERTFTQVVREEFINDGRLAVVDNQKADWNLKGEIKEYYLKPVSFDSRDNVTAYWIEMTLFIELTDVKKKKTIFKQNFHPHWDYRVTSAVSLSNIKRMEGINNAARDFGKTLTSLIIEGF